MHRVLTGPLTVEEVTIPIRDLPSRLHGCRIAQLSDFHFDGISLSTQLLNQAIEQVNRLTPDLVVLTGDFVTKDPAPIYRLSPYLQRLTSRHGTVAILGNHDNLRLPYRRVVMDGLRHADIHVLWNEIAYPLGRDFPIVGLADLWSEEFNPAPVMDQLPAHLPRLVMAHNPDSAIYLQPWRVDLQLSGHNHGGQIVLPMLGPLPSIIQPLQLILKQWFGQLPPHFQHRHPKLVRHWEWASGLHPVGQGWLYVNRGLGTYAPGRLFCPPELTLIQLIQHRLIQHR